MKALLLSILTCIFLIICLPVFYLLTSNSTEAQTLPETKTTYELPYAGILPDHPLYFIKAIRDKIIEVTTRDSLKKAQLYLNYSDKRLVMAMKLAEKGKTKQAISTVSKGEKYFLKIPDLLTSSKQQGVSASADFIARLKVSNAKHQEVIESLIKNAPQGDKDGFKEVLKLTKQISDRISTI